MRGRCSLVSDARPERVAAGSVFRVHYSYGDRRAISQCEREHPEATRARHQWRAGGVHSGAESSDLGYARRVTQRILDTRKHFIFSPDACGQFALTRGGLNV